MMNFNDGDLSALNSADQSPCQQPPHPQPLDTTDNNTNNSTQQFIMPPHHQQQTSHYNTSQNNSCILIDSPPQNPILRKQQSSKKEKENHQQQSQAAATTTSTTTSSNAQKKSTLFLPSQQSTSLDTCPFCTVDATRLTHEIRTLQQQVAQLTRRLEFTEEKTKQDRTKVENCFSQLEEYSMNLSVVTKWTKTVGSVIPSLVRGLTSSSSNNQHQHQNQEKKNHTSYHHRKTQSGGSKPPISGGSISAEVSAILVDEQQQDDEDEAEIEDNDTIPVKEVRKMFQSFRDEMIRLRERNEMLEQRINDAVCKFEASSVSKLKEEVEGRLRTMMHSLHETMSGSNSPTAELTEQVNSLRTEVEVVRSRAEASNTQRAVLEQRLNDATTKLKEMSERDYSRTNRVDQQSVVYGEEIREIRSAMKELSSTVNHRLESERSAREFDAGDIRSQLKVLLRSPSPMARIGGGGGGDTSTIGSGGLVLSTSPQR